MPHPNPEFRAADEVVRPADQPFRSLPWSILLAAALIAACSGLYMAGQLESRRSAEEQKLVAIADLKAREVERWREDLDPHAAWVARREQVREATEGLLATSDSRAADGAGDGAADGAGAGAAHGAAAILEEIAAARRYEAAWLVSLDGRVLASTRGARERLPLALRRVALAAAADRRLDVAVPVLDGHELRLVTTVPVNGEGGLPLAAVVMESPAAALLQSVRAWPVPSATGEIRILRRNAAHAELLDGDRRHGIPSFLSLALADGTPSSAAAPTHQAAQVLLGEDADGSSVMAALRPIAGTDWLLVASVQTAEVDEPTWNLAGRVASAAASLLVLVAAWLTLAAWRRAVELRSRQAALELSSAERIASIGTLAAGMAHELNSPLASVLSNARFALGELRASADARLGDAAEALEDAVEATQRAAAVVRSLHVLSGGDRGDRGGVGGGDVVGACVRCAANDALAPRSRAG